MAMKLPAGFRLDVDRARQIAAKLPEAYRTTGIFGNKETLQLGAVQTGRSGS